MTWEDATASIRAGTKIATLPEGTMHPVGAIERHATRCGCGRLAKLDALGRCFGCALADEERWRRFALKPHLAWMADESGPARECALEREAERRALCARMGVSDGRP